MKNIYGDFSGDPVSYIPTRKVGNIIFKLRIRKVLLEWNLCLSFKEKLRVYLILICKNPKWYPRKATLRDNRCTYSFSYELDYTCDNLREQSGWVGRLWRVGQRNSDWFSKENFFLFWKQIEWERRKHHARENYIIGESISYYEKYLQNHRMWRKYRRCEKQGLEVLIEFSRKKLGEPIKLCLEWLKDSKWT